MIATASASTTLLNTEIDAAALAEVERLFREQLSPLRLFPGRGARRLLAGRLVLDLAGGYADTQRGEPVGPDTLFPLFSGTKPLAAVALWQQIERGGWNSTIRSPPTGPRSAGTARSGSWSATSSPIAADSRRRRRS